ncbi:type II RES/Xre toxin-antitoxin system antitoxin [Membranihabitans maritimus]|uniref:type II RES/Xre toxin-antitoxin system antitoxin n=1 Tax=Membranihabitans maritimus TaxID=2904244 RepID=UPI001F25331C|nr:antitoxin Xre/MbcA/ParS toxin-binding domain-containing protein [Membranihabitans maritimus]
MKNVVKEPLLTYLRSGKSSAIRQEPLDENIFKDKLLMRSIVREGIPYSLFDRICSASSLNTQLWAKLMGISHKTIQRYEQDQKTFRPSYSEKILQLAEVFATGQDVFENREKFHHWLETPSFALGSQKPMDLLKDSFGRELVIRELNNIEYGIFA